MVGGQSNHLVGSEVSIEGIAQEFGSPAQFGHQFEDDRMRKDSLLCQVSERVVNKNERQIGVCGRK